MVKRKTMGIIFANMHDAYAGSMTGKRALASLPFAGRYRLVDFHLSSLVHAGIADIGVIVKENYHSLMRHIGAGKEWDLARKIEGVQLYPPFIGTASGNVSHDRVDAINNVLPYIKMSSSKYSILMDCDHVCNIDLTEFVNEHIDSGADISILCYKPDNPDESAAKNGAALFHGPGSRVTDITYNSETPLEGSFSLSMNVTVLERDLLIELIEDAFERQLQILERDILKPKLGDLFVRAHNHRGFVRRISSVQSYFHATMSLLDPQNRNALFLKDRPVITKVNDDAPVRYGITASVHNSLIADGCIIDGRVENSVLFRGVRVERGAVVKDSIIMQNSALNQGASATYIIADKYVQISEDRALMGYETYPLYIQKSSVV